MYARRPAELTRDQRIRAAWLWAGPSSVLCGGAAAHLLGEEYFGKEVVDDAVELWLPTWRTPPPGIAVRSWRTRPDSVRRRGMDVTTPARTAIDLARALPSDIRAIAALDSMCSKGGADPAAIALTAAGMGGETGVGRVRRLLARVDPAMQSPKETEVRLFMAEAGLPPMDPQVTIYDEDGLRVCTVDFANRLWKVGIEYDGREHQIDPRRRDRDSLVAIRVAALGWRVPRITQGLLRSPRELVGHIRTAFEQQGWRG